MIFWLLIAMVLVGAIAALLSPLMRMPAARPRYFAVLATGAGLPAFALAIYFAIGQWQTPEPTAPAAADVQAMVEQLATRLQRTGGNSEEWRMLGQSYMVMGRYADAVGAFGQARRGEAARDPELLAQYAEALALTDLNNLQGEAGAMFEQVLASRPRDPKALWYGAAAAEARGEPALARERWQLLLDMAPPEPLRDVLLARLNQTDDQASVPGNATSLQVSLSIAPGLLSPTVAAADVFVIARSSAGGPPLAVRRIRVADLPTTLTLSESDAMMSGRGLGDLPVAEVVARVSVGGTAEAQPGDLFGQSKVSDLDPGQPIKIIINQRVE